jgi:signal recognition particle subunit SRP54
MFDSLSDRFDNVFGRLRNRGRLSEQDIDEALREIRVALLEADVNIRVARAFVDQVKSRLVGIEESKALSPSQQVIKAVHEELVAMLGGEQLKITYASKPPTVVLLAGLQGSGKTTAAGKLARWFKAQGRNPLLAGADLQRPGAVEQLRTLAGQANVSMYSEATDPVSVAKNALEEARRTGKDVLIVDTAGRLAIDQELMEEVRQISAATTPNYTFLVIDAMLGQDAVNVAEAFHETLNLDGVILSKLDGDARGGAALSVKGVTGKPIVFASIGEKQGDFEPFYPDRMAQRILGMGDVLTLIEKAEEAYDKDVAQKAVSRLQEGHFTFEDFLEQLQQVKKMGSMSGLLKMLPGIPKEVKNVDIDDREIAGVEAMIRSMTRQERDDPSIINGSRRERIAYGSGKTVSEVNNLVKQFSEVQKMMKGFSKMGGLGGFGGRSGKKGKKGKGGGRVTAAGGKSGGMPNLPPNFPDLPGMPSK